MSVIPHLKRSSEAGSILALVPASVLVLLLLTSLAVDSAATFLAQRELADACVAGANDAATLAMSDDSLYRGESAAMAVDPREAQAVVGRRVEHLSRKWGREVLVEVANGSDPAVLDISLRAEAPLPIGTGAGPMARGSAVSAACQVTLRRR